MYIYVPNAALIKIGRAESRITPEYPNSIGINRGIPFENRIK